MRIHHYHPETGRYLGTGTADLCQVTAGQIAERAARVFHAGENALALATNPNGPLPYPDALPVEEIPADLEHQWLHPAHTTTIEPPAVMPEGFLPCFDAEMGKWLLTPEATAHGEIEPAIDPLSPEGRRLPREKFVRDVAADMLEAAGIGAGFSNSADAISYAQEEASPRLQKLGQSVRAYRSILRDAVDALLASCADLADIPTDADEIMGRLPAWEMPAPEAAPAVTTLAPSPETVLHPGEEPKVVEPSHEPVIPQPAVRGGNA